MISDGSKQSGLVLEQELGAYILRHRHKVMRDRGERGREGGEKERLDNECLEHFKPQSPPTPNDSSKDMPPN